MAIISVSTDSQLTTAMNNASGGDVVYLEPGVQFGRFAFTGLGYPSEVTVTTDPANPAKIKGFSNVNGSGKIRLKYLTVNPTKADQPGNAMGTTGTTFFWSNSHDCWVDSCRMKGALGTTTGLTAAARDAEAVYSANVWSNCHNGGMVNTEVHEYRYLMLINGGSDGQVIRGNFLHDWTEGDACQWQQASTNLTFDENYVTAFKVVYSAIPIANRVHADILQASTGPDSNLIARGNFFCQPYTKFGTVAPYGDVTQDFFLPTGGGTLLLENNVLFGSHNNIMRAGGFTSSVIKNNTVLRNMWNPPSTANKTLIDLAGAAPGPHVLDSNVARQIAVGSTPNVSQVNNLIITETGYAANFVNIKHDGTETFDDLRAKAGSSVITAGAGSIYTRTTGTYPAGYILADSLYNGGSGGGGGSTGGTRLQLPRSLSFRTI